MTLGLFFFLLLSLVGCRSGAKGASEKVMSMKATVLRTVTYQLQLDGTTIDIDTGSPASLLDRLNRSLAPPDR